MTEPSAQDAVRALTRVARLLDRSLTELSLADFRILSAVAEGEGRASRLAQRLAVGKPTVSSTVESLVRRGLLVRETHGADQRALELSLTHDGERALRAEEDALETLVLDLAARTADPRATLTALGAFGAAIEERQAAHAAEASGSAAR